MPFTPAHPAIVLPFIKIDKRFVSATGLIAGSVTPDFEYFFKMSVSGLHSHTIAGLFYFDLPIGCLLALVFHHIVKRRLLQNLPVSLQSRFHALREIDFVAYVKTNFVAFAISVLLGSASHILWDSFTHNNRFFVRELSFYKGAYIPFDGVRYPLWYALQHISTFAGLTILIIYIAVMKPQPGINYSPTLSYWILIVAITVLMVLIRFGFWPETMDLGNVVVSFISGLCAGVILAGLIPTKVSTNG